MAKIKFLVKSDRENQPASVYVRFSDKRGIDFITPTEEKVFPEYWSKDTQQFKQRIEFSELFTEKQKVEIEDRLTELRAHILRENKPGNEPSKEWLKDVVNRFYNPTARANEAFIQYVKRFIDEAKEGKRLASNGRIKKQYSWHSLRSMRGFELSLEKFHTETGKKIDWNDITIDFYNDFVKFFYDRNCAPNYVGKHIQILKMMMRQAREEGLHNNMEVERKAFKPLSEEVDNIYLTKEEVRALHTLDLLKFDLTQLNTKLKPSEINNLPVVRDVFLVGCYLAQRYSDYSRLNKGMIKTTDGRKYVELIQQKTRERVIIPIKPELDEILKRYDYTLPKTFQQKVNAGIKIIARLAGITEKIQIEQNRGGLTVKKEVAKCDLIKTHTARRTGCTLMYLAGLPSITIMKFSGHKTETEFLKYINVTKQETATLLSSHPYFNGNLKAV